MADKSIKYVNIFFRDRIYGSLLEYSGIIFGVSAVVSSVQNGPDLRNASLIAGGAFAYTVGKAVHSYFDMSAQTEKLLRKSLEKNLQSP